VELLDAGIIPEPCIAYVSFYATVLPVIIFRGDQKRDHLVCCHSRHAFIFQATAKCPGHSKELHVFHSFNRFCIHFDWFLSKTSPCHDPEVIWQGMINYYL
jgi:hypothetical protein